MNTDRPVDSRIRHNVSRISTFDCVETKMYGQRFHALIFVLSIFASHVRADQQRRNGR